MIPLYPIYRYIKHTRTFYTFIYIFNSGGLEYIGGIGPPQIDYQSTYISHLYIINIPLERAVFLTATNKALKMDLFFKYFE